MANKRKYNVKGSKDFIVLAGIFFFLCLWAVKDAWYPSPKTLEKHPHEVVAAFETSGSIGNLLVKKGGSINENQLLAELRSVKMKDDFVAAKKAYTSAKELHTQADELLRNAVKTGAESARAAELKQERADAQEAMDAALVKMEETRARIDASRLLAPSKGVVKELRVAVYDQVEAGETIVVIDPKDHFYLFNKSLAIFSFIAFWVFLGIHILAL